jgi:hypothetical protein
VQAIGRLVHLFSAAKFLEQFPRLLQNVLGFYRKSVDHLCVSETLNSVVLLADQWNVPQLKLSMDLILRDVLNEVEHRRILPFDRHRVIDPRSKTIMKHSRMPMNKR